MKGQALRALLPALVMALVFVGICTMPTHDRIMSSSISPDLPLGYGLAGWYGQRTQESAAERNILAADTKFSKGVYQLLRESEDSPQNPPVSVSIVYSGNDMNNSIHRPETCLPGQGHVNLRSSTDTLRLADGRELTFTRLVSKMPVKGNSHLYTDYVHYYVFIGHQSIQPTHMRRTLRDMYDRVVHGYVQRWAYLQVGSHWGGDSPFTQEQSEAQVRRLLSELLPHLIDWEAVGM